MLGSGNFRKVVTCVIENDLVPRSFDGKGYSCTRCVCTKLEKVKSASESGITDPGKSVWHIVRKNL